MRTKLSLSQVSLLLISGLILVRLLAMYAFPLFDTTEARYGEMARLMLETGNWLTPQFDYNVPFWGKPPLHTWLSASGIALLGVNELALRLPHLICGLVIMWLIYAFSRAQLKAESPILSVVVMATSLGFISSIGIVMTDTVLLLSLTLAMLSYWRVWHCADQTQGYVFFVALAIGMLAKGPVAVVLIGIPLGLWSLYHRQLWRAISVLPWGGGLVLFSLICLPWYILAEQATPGFLEYFLWGEHVQRFLVPGWEGDLYGTAHNEAKGTIWLFWLASAFPWSFVLIALVIKLGVKLATKSNKQAAPVFPSQQHQLTSYLFLWMLSPMLLFTMAGNILPAYVLPAIPPMALIMMQVLQLNKRNLVLGATSLALLIAAFCYFASGASSKKSEIYTYNLLSEAQKKQKVVYWKKRPFSAQYYFAGKAKQIDHQWQLDQLIDDGYPFILASLPQHQAQIELMSQGYCVLLFEIKKRQVWQCNGEN